MQTRDMHEPGQDEERVIEPRVQVKSGAPAWEKTLGNRNPASGTRDTPATGEHKKVHVRGRRNSRHGNQ